MFKNLRKKIEEGVAGVGISPSKPPPTPQNTKVTKVKHLTWTSVACHFPFPSYSTVHSSSNAMTSVVAHHYLYLEIKHVQSLIYKHLTLPFFNQFLI